MPIYMKILNFFLCIIEQLIFYTFFNTMFQKRFKSNSYLPFITAVLLTSVIAFYCGNMNFILKPIVCILLLTLSCRILYVDKIYIHTAFIITILCIISITEILFGNLFSLILYERFFDVFFNSISSRLVVCLISESVNIILVLTLAKFFSKSGLHLKRYIWILYNIVMLIFLIISVSFIYLYLSTYNTRASAVFFLLISILFLTVNFIVIYSFTKICSNFENERKLYLLESGYAALRNNMAFQNSNIEKLKKIRHDIKSFLMTIGTLLESGNISKAVQLLNSMDEKIDTIKTELAESTGNPLIDAVILQTAAVCENKHIVFSYKLTLLPEFNIKDADLFSVISNLLSNAVEAAEQTEKPFIDLSVSIYKSFLSIAVKNSYYKVVTTSDGSIISSKEDSASHGYGMQIVSDIANKYHGNFEFDYADALFRSYVILNTSF